MSLAVATGGRYAAVSALALDDDGFLLDHRVWNRTLAQQMADRANLGTLTARQWMIIAFVRDKYYSNGALSSGRNLCRRLGVDQEAVTRSFGSCLTLWQIAGLPHPGTDALSQTR